MLIVANKRDEKIGNLNHCRGQGSAEPFPSTECSIIHHMDSCRAIGKADAGDHLHHVVATQIGHI